MIDNVFWCVYACDNECYQQNTYNCVCIYIYNFIKSTEAVKTAVSQLKRGALKKKARHFIVHKLYSRSV